MTHTDTIQSIVSAIYASPEARKDREGRQEAMTLLQIAQWALDSLETRATHPEYYYQEPAYDQAA